MVQQVIEGMSGVYSEAQKKLLLGKNNFAVVKERWWHRLYNRYFFTSPDTQHCILLGKVTHDIIVDPKGKIHFAPGGIMDQTNERER